MSRSASPPPTNHATTIPTPQLNLDNNDKIRSTIEINIVTAASDPEPPPATAMDQNDPKTQQTATMVTTNSIIIPYSPGERDLRSLYEYEDRFDNGYDSDGRIGPFWECLEDEGEQDYDEDDLVKSGLMDQTTPM